MKRKNLKKFAELLIKAENATGRNEALILIKKAYFFLMCDIYITL